MYKAFTIQPLSNDTVDDIVRIRWDLVQDRMLQFWNFVRSKDR